MLALKTAALYFIIYVKYLSWWGSKHFECYSFNIFFIMMTIYIVIIEYYVIHNNRCAIWMPFILQRNWWRSEELRLWLKMTTNAKINRNLNKRRSIYCHKVNMQFPVYTYTDTPLIFGVAPISIDFKWSGGEKCANMPRIVEHKHRAANKRCIEWN